LGHLAVLVLQYSHALEVLPLRGVHQPHREEKFEKPL
jgi:hypothetical protein